MLFLALLDEQRRKKSADVCHDSRLATERYEQETILRGKRYQRGHILLLVFAQ